MSPPLQLMSGDWREIPYPKDGALVRRFQDVWLASLPPDVHAEKTNIHPRIVRAMPLVCYVRTLLCEVETVREPDEISIAAFLYGPFGIRLIDGKSAIIHDLNESAGVLLETAEQAATYGRFFCNAVHGDEGRFQVIEAAEQLGDATPADATRDRLGPMQAEPQDDSWRLSGTVRYGNTLFWAAFDLTREGLISMVDDDLLEMFDALPSERFEHPFRISTLPPKDGVDPS
jgi:hypothetical protein